MVAINARRFLGVIIALYFLKLFFESPIGGRWMDFPVYWKAGVEALEHRTVYDSTVYMQYRYSPSIALLFGWIFRPFSFEVASWVFQKLSLISWLILLGLWIRESVGNRTKPRWMWEGLFGFFILLFGSALRLDLQFGQVNSFALFLLYYGMKYGFSWNAESGTVGISHGKRYYELLACGLFLALAIQLKLYVLIALLIFVVRLKIVEGLVTLFFLLITSVGVMSIYHGREFTFIELGNWIRLLNESTPELILGITNINILGVGSRLLGVGPAQILWLAFFGFYLYLLIRFRKESFFLHYSIGCLGVYFLHPLTWTYWVLFFAPAFYYVIGKHILPRLSAGIEDARVRRASSYFRRPIQLLLVPALVTFNMQHSYYLKTWPLLLTSLLFLLWMFFVAREEPK